MKKLSDDLKRMLTGLAYQHVGEFLPMRDKMKTLRVQETRTGPTTTAKKVVTRPAVAKRIALITDGRGLGAPLDYAIDACLRQDARIDLLLHGTIDTESISLMKEQIAQAGIDSEIIEFGMDDTVNRIINYIYNRPSLIFLVAMPDDTAAKILIEEVIPKRGERIPVPLVLIDDQKTGDAHKRSAA